MVLLGNGKPDREVGTASSESARLTEKKSETEKKIVEDGKTSRKKCTSDEAFRCVWLGL